MNQKNKISLDRKKVFVAFLDILGYSKFIKNNSHDDVSKIFQSLFCNLAKMAIAHVSQTRNQKPWFKMITLQDGQQYVIANLENAEINSITMSDSIVFWTPDDSMRKFVDLIAMIKNFIVQLFTVGLPVRGTITHGDLELIGGITPSPALVNHQTLIGNALLDAIELERRQDWTGCVIHPDAIKKYDVDAEAYNGRIEEIAGISYLEKINLIAKYLVPFKDGSKEDLYVINWACVNGRMLDVKIVQESFTKFNKTITDREKSKIENTMQFMKDMHSSYYEKKFNANSKDNVNSEE